jgi:hypothetical protein
MAVSATRLASSFTARNPISLTPKAKAFDTSRVGKDRVSSLVKIEAMHYDEATSSIKVFGSDGNLRECRVARLPGGLAEGRVLWRKLQGIGKAGQEVMFVAAGGFSPDKWFYATITE